MPIAFSRGTRHSKLTSELGDFTFHDLRHCAINNLRLAGNDHFTIMTISGHKTTSVFLRYNVVTDDELQDVKWINDENFGVHIAVHQPRKTREIGWNWMMPNFLKRLETLMELPDFFMGNEKWGSFVRRSEWSEKRDSNPRPRAREVCLSYWNCSIKMVQVSLFSTFQSIQPVTWKPDLPMLHVVQMYWGANCCQ